MTNTVTRKFILVSGLLGGLGACNADVEPTQEELALQIGQGITSACPMADPGSEHARVACSAKLTDFSLLREKMSEPFFWGGQRAGKGYRLADSDTTRFNALVWRRMYLSLFMFTGQVRTETVGDFTVIHLPYAFRNRLDPGSYPYPFWHSKTKWDSWQLSPELILVMEKGKITGALRSAERDEARRPNYVERVWDGVWRWQADGKEQPYVTLYSFLFSPGNPHVTKLDAAYRAMESEMRSSNCLVCHSPDNFAKTGTLEFFNYPNQALYSRHSIVMHLDKNTMPPKNDHGFAQGLQDDLERRELLELAKAFERAGDEALAFEGELKPWSPPPAPVTPTP
jgi:hypothetical protein